MNQNAVIAANRFAMGARQGDIAAAGTDPQGWLVQQMTLPIFSDALPDSRDIIKQYYAWREGRNKNPDNNMVMNPGPRVYVHFSGDVIGRAIDSDQSLSWRLLDFFSNHFSVTARGGMMKPLAPTLEREAIAPNLYGQFDQMLLAVEQHPAMLVYLNNEQSIDPNSRHGRKNKSKGLNENLAREILELHTLGMKGGYDLDDIKDLAKAITGWSIIRKKALGNGSEAFVYYDGAHEPGARTVMGKRYPEAGLEQGEAILKALARHPSTAHHLSYKLARHFISDTPSEKLVAAMSKRWQETEGHLGEVIKVMIRHDDAWQPELAKFKTPREFLVSSCRAMGLTDLPGKTLVHTLTNLGQSPFGAGSPAGYDDVVSSWDGSDALLKRVDWCQQLTARIRPEGPPEELARELLGPFLSNRTEQLVSRAESRQQGLALVLMSPEFLRR